MIRAIFLAESIRIAEFWAREWGFTYHPRDWVHARDHQTFMGVSRDIPVFVCGPEPTHTLKMRDLADFALERGHTLIDSQDIDQVERLRPSLFGAIAR